MTPHFSDHLHMDRCAGRFCGVLKFRDEMKRIKGRRGWFCAECERTHPPRNAEV